MDEPRKATDILLSIEDKLDAALGQLKTQDQLIKLLNNKLNDFSTKLEKVSTAPKYVAETSHVQTAPPPQNPNVKSFLQPKMFSQVLPKDIEDERNIMVPANNSLPMRNDPNKNIPRTSRPDNVFAGDNAPPLQKPEIKAPIQMPKMPMPKMQNRPAPPIPQVEQSQYDDFPQADGSQLETQGQIPVWQRCVNDTNKAIFLADVEIMNLSDKKQVFKGRTNGTGKWNASLAPGNYRVMIRKRESLSNKSMESQQDIQVLSGSQTIELPTAIIR